MNYLVRYDANYLPNGSKTKLYIGTFKQLSNAVDKLMVEFENIPSGYVPFLNVERYAKDKSYIDSTPEYVGFHYSNGRYEKVITEWFTEITGFIEMNVTLIGEDVEIEGEMTTPRIECGKFYFNIDGTVISQGEILPTPPISDILLKVDKDLSGYLESATIFENAFTYVDNDGMPEKISIFSGDIESEVNLWTGGKIQSELDKKVNEDLTDYAEAISLTTPFAFMDNGGTPSKIEIVNNGVETDINLMTGGYIKSELAKKVNNTVVQMLYFTYDGTKYTLENTPPLTSVIGGGSQARSTASSIGWKTLGIFERTTQADLTINSSSVFNQNLTVNVSRNIQASAVRVTLYNDSQWGEVQQVTPSASSGVVNLGIIPVICNTIPTGTEIVLPAGEKYYVKIEYYQTQNAPLTVDLLCLKDSYVSTSQYAITGTSITTDLIKDYAVTNVKLAKMYGYKIKGNKTANYDMVQDLDPDEVIEILSPNGLFEIPYNLKVYGNIEQVGSTYQSHQQQLYTTKDHIILRDGAVSGLGTGQYAGLFAKLADGTNNAGLVFDGDGIARVGDIGTNLASPDFTETQALATREDTPASRSIPYWDETSKSFKTLPSFYISSPDESIIMTNGNSTNSNVPTLMVKSRSSIQAPMQGWYQDYQINNFKKATVEYNGRFTTERGISNLNSVNNGYLDFYSNYPIISTNLANTNPALVVDLKHASSTGNIQEWWSNVSGTTAQRARIDKDGMATFLGGILEPTIKNNAIGDIPLTINAITGQTANLQSWQVAGVEKAYIDKDGIYNGLTTGGDLVTVATKNTYYPLLNNKNNELMFFHQNQVWSGSSWTATNNYGVGINALANNTGANSNAFGTFALQNNTGASSNAFGTNALYNNTGAYANAFGTNALYNNTGAQSNAFGHAALNNNTGASSNAFGYLALYGNTGAYANAFGQAALYGNTGAYSNAFGTNALYNNTGASSNAFGTNALYNNTGAYANAFGYTALYGNTGAYANAFGQAALRYNQKANNTAIGHQSWQNFLDDTANNKTCDYTAIDTTLERATITAHGFGATNAYVNIKYASTTGTSIGGLSVGTITQVKIIDANTIEFYEGRYKRNLTSQGTGTHTFTPQFSYENVSLFGANTNPTKNNQVVLGDNNVTSFVFGGLELSRTQLGLLTNGFNEVMITNDAIGDTPLIVSAINGTTAKLQSWQVNSVEKAYIDKDGNGKMGKLWLELGVDNIAIGDKALYSLTTGSQNVAIGENAMYLVTSGQDNVAIGHDSSIINQTGNKNTSVGYKSLYQNQTNNNTALGYGALSQITTGSDNVGVGYRAGVYYAGAVYLNSKGTQGVFLGADTKASANGNSNEIVIGYNALGNGSNTATIGNSSLTGLYLGSQTAKFYGLVDYDNTTSGLTATNVKSAIDEVAGIIGDIADWLDGL